MKYTNQLRIALEQTTVKNLPVNYGKVITFMLSEGDITGNILELIVMDIGYSLDEFKALGGPVKSGDIFYSYDGESFIYETIGETIYIILCDTSKINNGDIVTIYSGETNLSEGLFEFKVSNTKEIKVKILDVDECKFELVGE